MSGNTALYQTAPVMVFLLSIPLLKERVNCYKVSYPAYGAAAATLVMLHTCEAGQTRLSCVLVGQVIQHTMLQVTLPLV